MEWSSKEDNQLRKLWKPGMSWDDTLIERFPGRTKDAIQRRASELGLTRAHTRVEWTDGEIAILRKRYPTDGKAVAERLPGRSEKAVKLQADRLGIIYTGEGAKEGTAWTEKEDQIIRVYYPREGVDCKSRLLRRRTDAAIRARATELGVTQRYGTRRR